MDGDEEREKWVRKELKNIPAGQSLLDIGAGECPYKHDSQHLEYLSQDVGQYDGKGNQSGLHTGSWDFSKIDIVCDILDIPENRTYDNILCTEVLEHVADPVLAIGKFSNLLKKGGNVILTAPFNSLTHFAPYHFATGFNQYWYRTHLERAGFEIISMETSGGAFDVLFAEISRAPAIYAKYQGKKAPVVQRWALKITREILKRWAKLDDGKSSELSTLRWMVKARKV